MPSLTASASPSEEFYLSVDESDLAVYFLAEVAGDHVAEAGASLQVFPSTGAFSDDWIDDILTFACFIYKFGPNYDAEGNPVTGIGHDGNEYDTGYASTTGIFFWGTFAIQPFRVQASVPAPRDATITYEVTSPSDDFPIVENPEPPSVNDPDPFLAAPSNLRAIYSINASGVAHVRLTWIDNSDSEDGFVIEFGNGTWQELVRVDAGIELYDDTYAVSIANALSHLGMSNVYSIFSYRGSKRSAKVFTTCERPEFTPDPVSGLTTGGETIVLTMSYPVFGV